MFKIKCLKLKKKKINFTIISTSKDGPFDSITLGILSSHCDLRKKGKNQENSFISGQH